MNKLKIIVICLMITTLQAWCSENTENVVIIGSGPAGLTAAIYASRARLNPIVIEGPSPGGQLTMTNTIENFPGFPDGIGGYELIEKIHQQASNFGTRFQDRRVVDVDISINPFMIFFDDNTTIKCKTLIIATGSSVRWLGLDSEASLIGKGVSACATCDGFFFQGKNVVVIGGGDTALQEALHLSLYAQKVTVVNRRDKLRASQYMQDKAFTNDKIHFIWDSVVKDIYDVTKNKVTGVLLSNTKTGEEETYPCDGVFVSIGHFPNTQIFEGKLLMDSSGYIITEGHSSHTSVASVFAAGDVANTRYNQGIVAAGTGCMAAMDAIETLNKDTYALYHQED